MWAGRDCDEVTSGPVLPVHGLDKLLEDGRVLRLLAEADDVHVDLLLLQLLGQLDEHGLVGLDRRAHEGHDARLVVLALTVLQGKLNKKGKYI